MRRSLCSNHRQTRGAGPPNLAKSPQISTDTTYQLAVLRKHLLSGTHSRQNLPRSPCNPSALVSRTAPAPGRHARPSRTHPRAQVKSDFSRRPSAATRPHARPLGRGERQKRGRAEAELQSCPMGEPLRAPHRAVRAAAQACSICDLLRRNRPGIPSLASKLVGAGECRRWRGRCLMPSS